MFEGKKKMEKNRISRGKIARILIILGALIFLTACTTSLPFIPNTGLTAITPTESWQRILLGIVGGILLIAGFALVKIFIQLVGFLGGGILGIYAAQLFFPAMTSNGFIGFVLGGLLGLGITLTATNLGVFVAGALAGAALVQQLWPYIENQFAPWVGLLIAAAIGGLLTLWLFNFWIAALTSAVGAILLGVALDMTPIYWLIFFAAGILIQTLFARSGRAGEKQETG